MRWRIDESFGGGNAGATAEARVHPLLLEIAAAVTKFRLFPRFGE
jgi:hypothetical protein